jgi:hypothetical protein
MTMRSVGLPTISGSDETRPPLVRLKRVMTNRILLAAVFALILAACANDTSDNAADASVTTTTTSSQTPNDAGSETTAPDRTSGIPTHLHPMAARWTTDFTNTVIDLNELQVGIPVSDPRDRIPPIDDPNFDSVENTEWIEDREPGVLIEINDDARFYPLAVLTRHEIVNDEVGEVPVAVTYCPLCNTAVVFDRRFGEEVLRLGVSGLLRNSDLVMWDLQSQTLWQQITGQAIVGEHAGESLTNIASAIVRWADFRLNHPDGRAMTEDQGFGTFYGTNPYEFYSSGARPFSGFFQGEIDDRYPALSRVVGVTIDEGDKAYPFSEITEQRVVNDDINGRPVAIFWGAAETADALDAQDISEARGIGTGVAYDPVVEGRRLTFTAMGDTEFMDAETGTTWTILGKAIDGELEGSELDLLPHRNEFWFAWQAFFPEATVWDG